MTNRERTTRTKFKDDSVNKNVTENEDKLLWNPYSLSEQDSHEYLAKSQENLQGGNGGSSLPLGAHIRDDEQVCDIFFVDRSKSMKCAFKGCSQCLT